jgi:cobalt-zinc-cadmium efflux system outer membrane protein
MLFLCAAMVLVGCTYNSNQRIDQAISKIGSKPYDIDPETPTSAPAPKKAAASGPALPDEAGEVPKVPTDVKTANFLQEAEKKKDEKKDALNLTVPEALPGSEAGPLPNIKDRTQLKEEIKRRFGPLEPLPDAPVPQPGPGGKPYTLSMLQEIAALNSPTLKQAVANVRSAEGSLIQARTYPNPTFAVTSQPSNNGETPGVWGMFLSQHVYTAGKMKLAIAAAQKDLDNAELALRKARSDLATLIRANYFGLLVAKESVRVNRALAQLTEEIYRAQVLYGGFVAIYEPVALRSQAFAARLQLQISITNYTYAWYQLVYSLGLRQLPLSEVAGRIDAHIPYFDYDQVLNYATANHTDILTAQNTLEKARYQLKLTQVTPLAPDLDFQIGIFKEFALIPFQNFSTFQVSAPIPVWGRNRGNIIAAEAGMVWAGEEQHRASLALATNIQNAYNAYHNNLVSLQYYRKHILPDQVQAYRGVLLRRRDDPNAQFGDLVAAQQTISTSVASYLLTLNQLWSSAIAVADFLQTDDLFSLARPEAIPPLPDFGTAPPYPCTHPNQLPKPLPPMKAIPRMSMELLGPAENAAIPVSGPELILAILRRQETEQEGVPRSRFRAVEQ